MISVIQKLGQHYSLARWLLCSTGLIRYLYPTDNELRQLANIPKDKSKSKKGGKHQANGHQPESFHVPRNLNLQLETAKVTRLDVVHLRYYVEYQWLVDFALYSIIVYIITEVYHFLITTKEEVNLSMMWCSLVLIFALYPFFIIYTFYKLHRNLFQELIIIRYCSLNNLLERFC